MVDAKVAAHVGIDGGEERRARHRVREEGDEEDRRIVERHQQLRDRAQ